MKLKYMVVGFIAGVFAATAITAGASTVYERFTAVARPDYKVVVDGHEVKLNIPPKTIDGATHLPVREIAGILGKEVIFNSGVIELNSKNSTSTIVSETVNYELGKLYTIGSTQFQLNSVSYKENTKFDFPTNSLLVINFNVKINSSIMNTWSGFDFFSHVNDSNQKISIAAEEFSSKINPQHTVTIELLVPVSDTKSAESVILKDPLSNETIEYKL